MQAIYTCIFKYQYYNYLHMQLSVGSAFIATGFFDYTHISEMVFLA